MSVQRIVIVGGGAAGIFAAVTCAEAVPGREVVVLEKGPQFLSKVLISGGGRCNVTHACFDPRELAAFYPRGERALLGAFRTFQPTDTVQWFESRGVKLKTQDDGCMFPLSDSSQTIIDCMLGAARAAGVTLRNNCGVERVARRVGGGFEVYLSNHETLTCDRLLLTTGGCRTAAAGQLAVSLEHTLVPPVPSLFTFQIGVPWLYTLAGIVVEDVKISAPEVNLSERGILLITHEGLSGPAVLRLSAWGARTMHALNYQLRVHINWLPTLSPEAITAELLARRQTQGARLVVNAPLAPLQARLWEQLVLAAGVARNTPCAGLTRTAQHQLIQQLIRTELPVTGKSLNKEEFVTCGGVPLNEVNFKTMESRRCPGLFFGGELLDLDGLTGGYNLQAAWTTGWIAGKAMGAEE